MSDYELKFYENLSKKKIAAEFIRTFTGVELSEIQNDLDALEKYGLKLLHTPLVKKIYKHPSIFELRIKSIRQIRLLFCFIKPHTIVILHGFIKKTRKTPKMELKVAIQRAGNLT